MRGSPHISFWGQCGLRLGDKAEAFPRGWAEEQGDLLVARIPPLPSPQGWVKSLHFLELSFLICKTGQERGLSE